MIKVIILFLFFAALSLFLTAELLLWLALPILPGVVFRLGSVLLLCGFALLFVTGLLLMTKIIIRSVRQYFSSRERLLRRLLFIQRKQTQIDRLHYFRKMHISYFHELNRKQLLKANEHQHIRSLSEAVQMDLLARKKCLPSSVLKELQQEHACCRRNRDDAALLNFQQKIADMV